MRPKLVVIAEWLALLLVPIIADRTLGTTPATILFLICLAIVVRHHREKLHSNFKEFREWLAALKPRRFMASLAIFGVTAGFLVYRYHAHRLNKPLLSILVWRSSSPVPPLFAYEKTPHSDVPRPDCSDDPPLSPAFPLLSSEELDERAGTAIIAFSANWGDYNVEDSHVEMDLMYKRIEPRDVDRRHREVLKKHYNLCSDTFQEGMRVLKMLRTKYGPFGGSHGERIQTLKLQIEQYKALASAK